MKRNYFHVKPLDQAQLRVWDRYLDWQVGQANHHRTKILFERCLIPCALYEQVSLGCKVSIEILTSILVLGEICALFGTRSSAGSRRRFAGFDQNVRLERYGGERE